MTDPSPPITNFCPEAGREVNRLRAEIEQLRKQLEAPPPRPTDLVKKLEVWKRAWGNDATTGLLDAAIAEIELLRAERDWARSEFQRAMNALDTSIRDIEWKWDDGRPGTLLVHSGKVTKPSRQEKKHILKGVMARGRISHHRKR